MTKLPFVLMLALLLAAVAGGYAPQLPKQTGITGRVITTDGQPLVQADVALIPVGGSLKSARDGKTNDKGAFSFDGVSPGAYSIFALDQDNMDFFVDEQNENFGEPRLCRPGDFVEMVVAREKSGVITGRITGPAGEPIVEAIVRAFRVRDSQGRRVQSHSPLGNLFMSAQRKTDDRGIYRIWALEPGSYCISVGGEPDRGPTFREPPPTDYDGDAPTYYGDSPLGAPTVVTVPAGAEVSGIDIQYLGGSGHTIRGTLLAKPSPGSKSIQVYLTNVATGAQQSGYLIQKLGRPLSFAFSKLPDGDFDIAAVAELQTDQHEIASKTMRVTVRGADVAGITLDPIEFASIAGRILLESTDDQNRKSDCPPGRPPLIEEAALIFTRDQQSPGPPDMERPYSSSIDIPVDNRGNFAIPRLEPGTYRLRPDLPGDTWYVSSITAPGPDSRPVASTTLSVKDGQRLSPLIISLRTGGARLHGKIVAATTSMTPPQSLRAYLVPLDPAAAETALRFAEAPVKAAGEFSFTHIAPGRYRLFALPATQNSEPPLAETSEGRALLHRRARRDGVEIELSTCQRVNSFALRYTAQ